MYMWTCVFVVVLCHGSVQGFFVPEFEFENECGKILDHIVGKLYFTADDLRWSALTDNQCSVTIKLIPSRSYSQIMFYFQTFDLIGPCVDTNLTITQQMGRYVQTTANIQGLGDFMCGRNRSMHRSGLNFTTLGDEFTITYRFSEKGKRLRGYFSITFLEFHTGGCHGEHLRTCMYTRNCVRKEYHCSSDIQACPIEDLKCDALTLVEVKANILGTIGKVSAVLVAISVVFYLMKYCGIETCASQLCKLTDRRASSYTRGRHEVATPLHQTEHSAEESPPLNSSYSGIPSDKQSDEPPSYTQVNHYIATGPIDPVTLLRTELPDQGTPSLTSSHSGLSFEQFDDEPPSYANLNNQLVLYVPPPRFANNDEVEIVPSYEDVLADTARYQTSLL